MQTFLPYANIFQSAKVLDRQRLGKQRVEAYQILLTLVGKSHGWKNHPAVKMWRGHEMALGSYGIAMCQEWTRRGYRDNLAIRIFNEIPTVTSQARDFPSWFGDESLHASHRSNLLRKMPEHYRKFGWTEPADLPYVWPHERRPESDWSDLSL